MTTIKVNASKKYNIYIDKDLLPLSSTYIKNVFDGKKVLIISDSNVAPLYLNIVETSLKNDGFEVFNFVFDAGEKSKNYHTMIDILEYAASCELSRKDLFVALGGGVVGDVCGLCASLYMRGVKFVQIPTTLLACVDSSVGGKTAIDLKAGKNLCGAFWQPSLVLCDVNTLNTLNPETFSDGMAEVIKYGVICDKKFFDFLTNCDVKDSIIDIIATCVQIKADIVEEDEFDNGRRALLNLGHTFGHAIEKLSNFSISHGSAVAIGCCIASKVAFELKISEFDFSNDLVQIMEKYNLPHHTEYSYIDIANACLTDKKRNASSISLVLPKSIGNTIEYAISISNLNNILKEGLNY